MFAKIKHKVFNSKLALKYFSKYTNKISYSQYGEDKILDFALKILKNKNLIDYISYLDLGGCFAIECSNTYFLYRQGYTGVVIEAVPELAAEYKKIRKNDIVLNIGVTAENSGNEMPFYFAEGVCGSFDKSTVLDAIDKCGLKNECKQMDILTRNINDIMSEYFSEKTLFLFSIDVEGIDEDILKSLDFRDFKPYFFCVETADLSGEKFLGKKKPEIISFMAANGYEVYADTYINTIFIRKDILEKMF